jgi:hypothetical protein
LTAGESRLRWDLFVDPFNLVLDAGVLCQNMIRLSTRRRCSSIPTAVTTVLRSVAEHETYKYVARMRHITLEQATKAQRENRGIALLFL